MNMKSKAIKTILVVDDEEIIRSFFIRTLKEYKVITAVRGEEAVEIVRKNKPDLVLLDIKMQGIDGIETLRQIKQIDDSIVVIILSAHRTVETDREVARLGAYSAIAKPFDLKEMKEIIKRALNK
jgi:DNA-binding NtrC family response regulator